ncbi:MAG: DegV family protein [Clostridiales bacterium]|nr:DegV family protein [Clostridiales bacterium]
MIQIVTDSMSDIRQEEARREGVVVLPQHVLFGEESFADGVDLTTDEFYLKLSSAKVLPKTSQVTPEAFDQAFRDALAKGDDVLCITGSSRLSGTFQSATIARDMQKDASRIFLVDSLNASLGQQILIWQAVRMRDCDMPVEEILSRISALRERISLVGQVQNLKHLVMGGRLSVTTARLGTTLNLRPMIRLVRGKLEQDGLTRGRRRSHEWFAKQLLSQPRDPDYPVHIASAMAPMDLTALREALEKKNLLGEDVREVGIGPIVGTHTGQGVLALAWVRMQE